MTRRRPPTRHYRIPDLKSDKTPFVKLGQILFTTYEEEKQYLQERSSIKTRSKGWLPSPEEIAEMKAIIREENEERERLEGMESRFIPREFRAYKLDTSGMEARRGKLI